MEFLTTKLCSTKQYEGGDAVVTELTIDGRHLTIEEVWAIAVGAGVIKWQSPVRTSKEPVPTKATYLLPRPGTRAVAAPMTTEALLAELEKRGEVNKVIKYAEKYLADIEANDEVVE